MTYPTGSKNNWQVQANAIKSGEIETRVADIPHLLEWLRDMNWPGAKEIAEHLKSYKDDMVSPVRGALDSNDDIWKYWILHEFSNAFNAQFWSLLSEQLERVACNSDESEGANLEALFIIANCRLKTKEWIVDRLEDLKSKATYEACDYEKINAAYKKLE